MGEEMLLASAGVGDSLPWTLMPEPSPTEGTEWIKWHVQQPDMLACWQELKEVPGQDNLQEFARRVWASFEVPKQWCCASKVDNDDSALLAHHSLDRDQFLPLPDMQFGSQDFQLTQPQKTLAYAKALQYWAEKAQLPIQSEPCQLAESVLELWQMMEPLTTFTDKDILEDILPSNWVKIMPSRLAEPTQQEHSCTRTHQAYSRRSFLAAQGGGWPWPHTTATTQTTVQATLIQEVMLWQAESSSQLLTPPPGFAEIAQSLHGDSPPRIVAGIPLVVAEDHDPIQMIGSSMVSAHLFRDSASGAMCIDLVTCSLSLVGMGLDPMVDDHHVPTLQEAMDSD